MSTLGRVFELAFDKTNARQTHAHRSRATDIPHTRRPRARPTPAGRKGSDSLGRQQNEYILHSMCKNAERNEAVRLTSPAHAPRLTDLPH